MKKTIAIDMDGVLADVEAHCLNLYNTNFGTTLTKADILGNAEYDLVPDGLLHEYVHAKGFFRDLPVMEGAIEALAKLSEDFELYIVSAAMEFPQSLAEKREWLAEFFPFISWKNIIFCGDKSIIKTDYMIDDHCKNLDFCHGMPLLFSAYHNPDKVHHKRFDDWKSIVAFLEKEIAEADFNCKTNGTK